MRSYPAAALLATILAAPAAASPSEARLAPRLDRAEGFSLPVGASRLKDGPLPGAPADAARAFFVAHPEALACPVGDLSVRRIIPLGGPAASGGYGPLGATARLSFSHHGIPGDGDAAVVRLDAQGFVRSWRQRCPRIEGPEAPSIPLDRAVLTARRVAPVGDAGAALVWHARGERARLSWRIQGAEGPGGLPWEVFIDATSGLVREVRPLFEYANASAYLLNPLLEDAPTPVELPEVFDETVLAGPRGTGVRFVDQGDLYPYTDVDEVQWWAHVATGTYLGSEGGDFTAPALPYPEDPARDEDTFGVPQAYYIALLGKDRFAALGLASFDDEPYSLVTNLRLSNTTDAELLVDPEAPLLVYENAYFNAGYRTNSSIVPAGLTFGQGQVSDYVYDADVVLHELGHGMVDTVGAPRGRVYDNLGNNTEPAALNEAIADYFSSATQGDPYVGEYAGLRRDPDGHGVRDLSQTLTCPADIIGQQHNDGQVYSGPLWALRSTLGEADQAAMDEAVFAAVSAMDVYMGIADASNFTVDVLGEILGLEVGEAARALFDAQGALDCERILPLTPLGLDEPVVSYASLPSPASLGSTDPMPAYVQLSLEIPVGRQTVRLRGYQPDYQGVKIRALGTNRTPQPLVVMTQLGSPLSWGFEEGEEANTLTTTGAVAAAFEANPDVEPLHGPTDVFPAFEARFDVTGDGRRLYLQLANLGDTATDLYYLSVDVAEADDEGPGPQTLPQDEGCRGSGEDDGGCGSSGKAGLVLALIGLARRRRRSGA